MKTRCQNRGELPKHLCTKNHRREITGPLFSWALGLSSPSFRFTLWSALFLPLLSSELMANNPSILSYFRTQRKLNNQDRHTFRVNLSLIFWGFF